MYERLAILRDRLTFSSDNTQNWPNFGLINVDHERISWMKCRNRLTGGLRHRIWHRPSLPNTNRNGYHYSCNIFCSDFNTKILKSCLIYTRKFPWQENSVIFMRFHLIKNRWADDKNFWFLKRITYHIINVAANFKQKKIVIFSFSLSGLRAIPEILCGLSGNPLRAESLRNEIFAWIKSYFSFLLSLREDIYYSSSGFGLWAKTLRGHYW